MDEPSIYIPPDVPGQTFPSGEDTPEAVTYFRLYAGVQIALHAVALLGGFSMILRAATSRSNDDVFVVVVAIMYIGWALTFSVPWVIALSAGRRPWVHTLGTVMLALSMLNLCCIPLAIPVLLGWQKPEVKRWLGAGAPRPFT